VMIAYRMNGSHLPLLNGFPLRLVVPGWYSTYWVKMLTSIEVLDTADDNFWMSKAYLIPDTPGANIVPGQQGVHLVPINRMLPRSFFTNLKDGQPVAHGETILRGIAFGGDTGVAKVMVSVDGGLNWQDTKLGADHGKYSFRAWTHAVRFSAPGARRLMVKCVNTSGVVQPEQPNWNSGGYMRNVIESVGIEVT
jgi:Oxidoreductase molybdopterin binding domain/Mo-co oxidoreductase dimerisation domain